MATTKCTTAGTATFRPCAFSSAARQLLAMQNSKWILVCLDTSYKDFHLTEAGRLAIVHGGLRGHPKLILLSDHQPASQLDDQGPKLQAALTDLLSKQRIHAWPWGN